jgi:hypothetical protein
MARAACSLPLFSPLAPRNVPPYNPAKRSSSDVACPAARHTKKNPNASAKSPDPHRPPRPRHIPQIETKNKLVSFFFNNLRHSVACRNGFAPSHKARSGQGLTPPRHLDGQPRKLPGFPCHSAFLTRMRKARCSSIPSQTPAGRSDCARKMNKSLKCGGLAPISCCPAKWPAICGQVETR